jgi:hypothetical protein
MSSFLLKEPFAMSFFFGKMGAAGRVRNIRFWPNEGFTGLRNIVDDSRLHWHQVLGTILKIQGWVATPNQLSE